MGLDNGFVIKNAANKLIYDDCYWRKDYAVRDIVLSYLEVGYEGGEYNLSVIELQDIILRFADIEKYGKIKYDEYTDQELPWYMDDELCKCYDIENEYEKKAKIDEVYRVWARQSLRQFEELMFNIALEYKYGDVDSTIWFYDSF